MNNPDWQNEAGQVWLGCNSPEYLARWHRAERGAVAPLTAVADLIAAAVENWHSSG